MADEVTERLGCSPVEPTAKWKGKAGDAVHALVPLVAIRGRRISRRSIIPFLLRAIRLIAPSLGSGGL
jgi:hypothetical protein